METVPFRNKAFLFSLRGLVAFGLLYFNSFSQTSALENYPGPFNDLERDPLRWMLLFVHNVPIRTNSHDITETQTHFLKALTGSDSTTLFVEKSPC